MIREPITTDTTSEAEIRPFRISVPEKELVDMRRRIAATNMPATVPTDIEQALHGGGPPAGLSADERQAPISMA